MFCRTGGFYAGVVTMLGIVENVVTDIRDAEHFKSLCRKRSMFTDEELVEQWEWSSGRPFIVNFLYAYSLPKRINLKRLIEIGAIANTQSVPRGFSLLPDTAF